MDFSKIKLIVSDMDGTLLNSEHEVSEEFFRLQKELQQRGITFAVASGRQYYSLMERMEPLKDELSFIAENGAIVMEKGEQVFMQPMDEKIVQEVIKEVRAIGGKYLVLCGREQAYIESTDPEFMKPFLEHYEKYKVVDDLLEVKDDVFLKLTICDLSGAEEHSLPKVKHFEKELQVKLSGKIWIDFNHKEAHKGNALKALQKLHGLKKENTMAFGDYLNDMELFENSAISVAVENAHSEVREAAKYHTKSHNEQGVEEVLRDFLAKLDQ
ncbi:HAD family hydrolase [Salinimicrobium catena]|uniref:HAD family hydrolase n=1 Tax=Salinimicrobium catena TaxID=390640 RepID=UPI002FE47B89